MQRFLRLLVTGAAFVSVSVALAMASSAETSPGGQVPLPQSAHDVPPTVAGAPISPEYVAAIGRFAYIWGWPLVNMHNRHATFAKAPHPGLLGGVLPVAPIGQIAMLSGYVAPEQRFVTSPNQDVVYGAGFMSVDEDPVIIQVPDFGDRFWVYQIVDQRTDLVCQARCAVWNQTRQISVGGTELARSDASRHRGCLPLAHQHYRNLPPCLYG